MGQEGLGGVSEVRDSTSNLQVRNGVSPKAYISRQLSPSSSVIGICSGAKRSRDATEGRIGKKTLTTTVAPCYKEPSQGLIEASVELFCGNP